MDEVVVAATARVGIFGSTDFDFAVTLRNRMDEPGTADPDKFGFVRVVHIAQFVKHVDRIP